MPIGRNDPCPCGSGQKYKKCHGALASTPDDSAGREDVRRAAALKKADVQLGDRLLGMARRLHGADWLIDALDAHGLLDEDGALGDAELSIVVPWLEHMARDARGVTLADELRVREGTRLRGDELLLLDAYDRAWVSVWEVTEVDRGVGSHVVDRLTGQKRFALDASSSRTLNPLDSVLAIVLDCDGVSFFGGVHAVPLPPRFADIVVANARRACRVRTRPVAVAKLRDQDLQAAMFVVWELAATDMLDAPPPALSNTDGDPLVLTKDVFSLVGPASAVIQHLATLPGADGPEEQDGESVFVVSRAGGPTGVPGQTTLLARIAIAADRLVIETNSTRRADTMRARVEGHLAGLVRFRVREEQNAEQLMAEIRAMASSGAPGEREDMDPTLAAVSRQFRQEHMARWIAEPVPALGGQTPREAATTKAGRARLEALIRDFEWSEARMPEAERIDLGVVRDALGLPRRGE